MNKNKVVKAVATVTIFSVVTRALSFIFKIYLSRELGAEAMGLYQICLSLFFLFSSLSASGLPTVLSRKTAEARAFNEKESGNSLFSTTLLMGLILSLVTLCLLVIAKPFLPMILADERAVPLFLVMAPALVSTAIYSIIRGWFWGRKQFTYFAITETIEEVFRILFSVLFVSGIISGISGAYGIALAFTISDIGVGALLVILFFAKGGRITKLAKVKEIFKPALPLTAMRLFGSLISTLIALMLPIRLMASGLDLGEATASLGRIMGMANPLILAPNAIISSLAIVLIPEMSENGIKNDFTTLNKQINNAISFGILVSGMFMFCYIALGDKLTSLLYDDVISGQYLQVAALMMPLTAVNLIMSSALNSIGLEKEGFYNYIIGTIVMVIIVYFMPPLIGIYAVAVATMASLIIIVSGNCMILKKKTNFEFRFLKTLVYVSAIMIPCCYIAYNLYGIFSRYIGDFGLVLAALGGLATYGILAMLTDMIDIKMFSVNKKHKIISF